jgi:hypothetical protein
MQRCFKIHPSDNVGTMLDDAAGGSIEVLGQLQQGRQSVDLKEPIKLGHKAALADIPEGAPIVKFGVVIGLATAQIRAGQWIHLHNCRSQVDDRSGTLDNDTGAPTDTTYQ